LFEAEDIRDWRGHDVVDPAGSKIGSLEAVYFDTATEQPTFATVKVGMVGRHRLVFVPLFEARVSRTMSVSLRTRSWSRTRRPSTRTAS
jgi:hypothetical protein